MTWIFDCGQQGIDVEAAGIVYNEAGVERHFHDITDDLTVLATLSRSWQRLSSATGDSSLSDERQITQRQSADCSSSELMEVEMPRYSFREMPLSATRSMIRYFINADLNFLHGMGVDPAKLPSEEDWFGLLQEDFARPLPQRYFYYILWEVDDVPVGHCNINKIAFGDAAYIHLHIWTVEHRRGGCATRLLPPSIGHFFERFQLCQLFCEPYALNPAPNKALPKAGFKFVKTYETTPGWITFHQPVNLWALDRTAALTGFD